MKASVLVILVFVGASRSDFLSWKPGRSYVYDARERLLSPELSTENRGLVVNYKVTATVIGTDAVHLNVHDFNAVGVDNKYAANSSIINQLRSYIESPMEITIQNGVVQSLKVKSGLPQWALDIKMKQASHFSADYDGFYRPPQSQKSNDNYAYKSMEASLYGQCETKYTVNQMNGYDHNAESDYQARTGDQVRYSSWKSYCGPDDKLYEIVKSTKLYKCNGKGTPNQNENNNGQSINQYKPKAVTYYIACGRRSRQQFNILRAEEEYQNPGGSDSEMMFSLRLIGTNPASPVEQIPQPKLFNDMFKSYSEYEGRRVYWNCDCQYQYGGCTITRAAPPSKICRCKYLAWTCWGLTENCGQPNHPLCKNPDTSYESCVIGGGDCGGYWRRNRIPSQHGTGNQEIRNGGHAYDMVMPGLRASAEAQNLNWDNAQKYCKEKHGETGRLVNIDDEGTFLLLQAALGQQYPGVHLKCWVDGFYDEKRQEFIWGQRVIPVDQPWTPWGKGEPKKPFTPRRRVVYHQVTDTRAEFHTDDTSSLHGYLCQYMPKHA